MIFVCALLVIALVAQSYFAWREREKLTRRIASPQQVVVEESKKHEPATKVWSDDQYKKLMQSRGQMPVDN
jgi:hypothetical protein